ncbi:hypothetical protein [Sphingomonas sp. PB4P5]
MLDDLVAADMRPRTLFEENTRKRDRLMGRWTKSTGVSASGPR